MEGEGGGREGEWEVAGGREWVGLVGGVRDALVVVHLNKSGSMPTSYYYYDSSLGGARDALVVVQLSRSGSSVDKRRSPTSPKNEVLSTSSAPGILERVLEGLRGVLEALDHLGSS